MELIFYMGCLQDMAQAVSSWAHVWYDMSPKWECHSRTCAGTCVVLGSSPLEDVSAGCLAWRELQGCFFSVDADVAFWAQLNLVGFSVTIAIGIQM